MRPGQHPAECYSRGRRFRATCAFQGHKDLAAVFGGAVARFRYRNQSSRGRILRVAEDVDLSCHPPRFGLQQLHEDSGGGGSGFGLVSFCRLPLQQDPDAHSEQLERKELRLQLGELTRETRVLLPLQLVFSPLLVLLRADRVSGSEENRGAFRDKKLRHNLRRCRKESRTNSETRVSEGEGRVRGREQTDTSSSFGSPARGSGCHLS